MQDYRTLFPATLHEVAIRHRGDCFLFRTLHSNTAHAFRHPPLPGRGDRLLTRVCHPPPPRRPALVSVRLREEEEEEEEGGSRREQGGEEEGGVEGRANDLAAGAESIVSDEDDIDEGKEEEVVVEEEEENHDDDDEDDFDEDDELSLDLDRDPYERHSVRTVAGETEGAPERDLLSELD